MFRKPEANLVTDTRQDYTHVNADSASTVTRPTRGKRRQMRCRIAFAT